MNKQRLTELDPTKVYVDPYGRKWKYDERNHWWVCVTEDQLKFYERNFLVVYPDIRERVPAWYEDAVAKGPWVLITESETHPPFIACMGRDGFTLRIRQVPEAYSLLDGTWGHPRLEGVTLAECLAAAEPLIWKGEAR